MIKRAECDAVQQQLLDGPSALVDVGARRAIESHLAACAKCRDELAWDARLADLLRSVPDPVVPATLLATVTTRVDRRRRRAWLASGVTLAASLAVATTTATIWQPGVERQTIVATHHRAAPAEFGVESLALFAPPPVDTLDILGREQGGYVSALQRLGKE